MAFPYFFAMILGAIIVVAAIVAIYFQLYKRNVNRAIKAGNETAHTMAPPFHVLIITAILVLILTTIISYFVGYKTAYDRMENAVPPQYAAEESIEQQTFYAEIISITGTLENGNLVTVEGLSVNEINYRGEFSFSVFGETSLEWHNTSLEFSELEIGDTISITFSGEVQETSPATISQVLKIQLLDDNK